MRSLHRAALLPLSVLLPSALASAQDAAQSGYLKVSDRHSIYYETHGNEDGIPAICLHGGPGGMAGRWMCEYFDLSRFRVVLFDQRGAGRSKPRAEWRENTTQLLIEDIDKLRGHLGIDGKAVFGGSWGTTLALAYAEAHPEKVSGLVLRGVFLGTKREKDHFYHGGAALFFPDTYEILRALVPEPNRLDYPRQIFELTQHGDPEVRRKACSGWVFYEVRMTSMGQTDAEVRETLRRNAGLVESIGVLENHYLMNDCFLEEGQLLRDIERIAHLPTYIVNGRFDAICPPLAAWQLSKRLREVKLELLDDAAHSSSEPAIHAALKRGVAWVAERVAKERRRR